MLSFHPEGVGVNSQGRKPLADAPANARMTLCGTARLRIRAGRARRDEVGTAEVGMTTGSHERTTTRRPGVLLLLPLLLSVTVGCHALNFLKPKGDKVDDRADAEKQIDRPARSGLPSQYQFRIAPFVFVSDWKISQDQPLFVELGEMRDQV